MAMEDRGGNLGGGPALVGVRPPGATLDQTSPNVDDEGDARSGPARAWGSPGVVTPGPDWELDDDEDPCGEDDATRTVAALELPDEEIEPAPSSGLAFRPPVSVVREDPRRDGPDLASSTPELPLGFAGPGEQGLLLAGDLLPAGSRPAGAGVGEDQGTVQARPALVREDGGSPPGGASLARESGARSVPAVDRLGLRPEPAHDARLDGAVGGGSLSGSLGGSGGVPLPNDGQGLLSLSWLADPQSWQVGAVVAGRYRLLEAIGTGGMGDVLLAEDLLLLRKVALKVLRRNLTQNPQAFDRFRQEVAMAHAVSHPNLARTFDIGETGGVVFLTMEFLPGETLADRLRREGTLADRLRREGPLPVAEVRRIALEVTAALDAAHQAGVIHRDLKPSNIQLTPDRGAVVMDFGLAAAIIDRRASRQAEGMSELMRPTSKSAGTPNYMAPEQWRGEPQGVATDLYSFGCILFEALTGRLPFQAQTRAAMMRAHLEDSPPSVRSLCPGVPKTLDRLIGACLAKDPQARPGSMFEAARLLLERQVRHSVITAALATGVLALLLVGGYVIWQMSSLLLLHEMRPAIKRLAMLAARDIDGADLDRVHRPADIDTPSFQRIWQVLDRLRRENPEVRYIYTMRKLRAGSMWEFVVDSDPKDADEDGDGRISEEEKGAPPGLKYDGASFPWLSLTFLEDRPQADDRFTSDPWGLFLSGYAPIRAPGDDFYVVGVDVTNGPLLVLRNTLFGVFCVLGLVSAVVIVGLRRRKALLLAGFGRVRVG